LIFPTRVDIINLNLYHIQHTGGLYQGKENLLHPGKLEWVLAAIRYPLFGVMQYPSLAEKAAILTWKIIAGHIFFDGNKRTGISVLKIFVRANGFDIEASDEELMQVALNIAQRGETDYSLDDFELWLRQRFYIHSSKT
jgi:death-on-curing protein